MVKHQKVWKYYDQDCSKIKLVQYNAALSTTGTLGIEQQHHKSWLKRFCFFKKVLSNKVPEYIRHSLGHLKPFTAFLLHGFPFFLSLESLSLYYYMVPESILQQLNRAFQQILWNS